MIRKAGSAAAWAVIICAAIAVMINIHEIGHVVIARFLGDPIASYSLYYNGPNRTCIGCTFINYNSLTANGLIAVNSAGVVTTQIVAVIAAFVLNYRSTLNRILEGSLIALIGACLLDGGYQAFQGFRTSIPPNQFPTNVDAVDLAFLVGAKTEMDPKTVVLCMAVVTLVWIGGFVAATWHSTGPNKLHR